MNEGQEELLVTVYASYHQFFLAPLNAEVIFDATRGTQLLDLANDGRSVIILTGCADGPVNVTVRIAESEPSREHEGSWDEVEQVTMRVSETLRLSSPTWAELFDDIVVPPTESDLYAVRCYVRGRGCSGDLSVDHVTEHFLLEIWPA